MAKVVRKIEITEEEAQILGKAYVLIDILTSKLHMSSADFFDQLGDIEGITMGKNLNKEVITDDNFNDYEIKIVDK